MGMALQEQANPTSFIEYNGYMFGTRTKSRLQVRPQKDSSGRTEIMRKYMLAISSIIVPRRNIPGDGTALNIQLNRPAEQAGVPGITPNNIAATVDSEIKLIIEKLTETGKTLRYIGQGVGDIVVNTLHPKTGQFIQDLNYGPHCAITKLEPLGFNKCYRIEWECEFNLPPGKIEDFSLNELHKRILEYNYGVDYRYDSHGYCTRNIQGHIKIVPPVFRGLGTLPPTGCSRNTEDEPFAELEEYTEAAVRSLKFGDTNREKLNPVYYSLTALIKKYREDCLLLPFEAALSEVYIERALLNIDFGEDSETAAIKFQTVLELLEDAYTPNGRALEELAYKEDIESLEDIVQSYFFLRNYLITGMLKKVPVLRKYPEIANMFPSGVAPLNNKICYGPFAFDNIGNLQNYETVDQYKQLIWDSIVLPHNFRREGHSWSIDQNKSGMRFSITDKEYPPFSFVPGYSSVTAHQDTSSTGAKFLQFSTQISATFKMGKHIHLSPNETKGYADSYKNDNILTNYSSYTKQLPSKREAFADFLKLVFQRLAVPLLLHNKGINITTTGPDKKTLEVKSGMTCIPHSFQCREDIFTDTITYTVGYKLTSEINSFFVITGHGLPAIIASDLNITKEAQNITILEADRDTERDKRVQYVSSILFSKYTDVAVHRDWMLSQKHSSMSPRGGSNIFFDRSFDRPINITVLAENYTRTIPLHGEYPNLQTTRSLTEFNYTSYKIIPGYFGSNIISPSRVTISSSGGRKEEYFASVYQDHIKPSFKIHKLRHDNSRFAPNTVDIVTLTKEEFEKYSNEQAAKLAKGEAGFYMRYTIYKASEYIKVNGDKDIIGLPLANDDIDIFEEDLANELPPEQSPVYTSTLTIPTIKYPDNGNFNPDEDGNEYVAVDDFVAQNVGDFITRPSPINSWLSYECELKIDTDNKIIRHKVLPQSNVLSDFGAAEIPSDLILNELIQTNHDAIFNTGPNSLKGGSPASDLTLASPTNTDIIQTLNEPSHTVILTGYAARLHYEVVAPTLLKYGGCSVIQKRRIFTKKSSGEADNQTHYGAWYIEYYVDGHPSGFLGTPETPWQVQDEQVPITDQSVTDTLVLEEQTNLLNEAASLIGFAVSDPNQ